MGLQKILPPVWFLLALSLIIGLHLLLPVRQLFLPPITYLCLEAIALGIITILFCADLFKRNQTAIVLFRESSYLIRESIFNYSRNPIYLRMILVSIGVWFYLASLTPRHGS